MIQLNQPIQKVHDLVAVSRHLASVDSDWQWDEENLAIFQLVRFWPGIQALRPQQTMQTSCSVSPERYALRCYPCCIYQPELSLKPSSPQLVAMADEIEWFRSLAAAQK